MKELRDSLLEAVVSNNEENVKESLNRIAERKIDINDSSLNIVALKCAIYNKSTSMLKLLLEFGADVHKNEDDCPLMCYASQIGDKSVIELLLKNDAKIDDEIAFYNTTSLHIAAAQGNKDLIEFLLSCKAEIDVTEKNGTTPLLYACGKSYQRIKDTTVEELFLKYNLPECNNNENVLSDQFKKSKEVAELLLNSGANISHKDVHGQTALHIAASCGHKEIVELLINRGINVTAPTTFGETALHVAIHSGHKDIVELCLDRGVSVELSTKTGTTPLICAVNNGHPEIVKLLLGRGAKINAEDQTGYTALHIVLFEKYNKEILDLLFAHGADIHQRADGETLLHCAVRRESKSALQWLLDRGVNPDAKDVDGLTPMDIAVRSRCLDLVELMLARGVKINTSVKKIAGNLSAVYCAAFEERHEMLELLLRYGGIIDFKDPSRNLSTRKEKVGADRNFIKVSTKLSSIKSFATQSYLGFIDSSKELKTYQKQCEKEIERMKNDIIAGTTVSHYDVMMTRRASKLALLADNENIVKAIKSKVLDVNFPIYHNCFVERVLKGVRRRELLNELCNFFSCLLDNDGENLPLLKSNCVTEIFSYIVSNEDLESMISALNCENDI